MKKTILALSAVAVVAVSVPVAAHHAFGAEFDRDAPIRLRGKVVRLEWVNPHSWIHLEVNANDPDAIQKVTDTGESRSSSGPDSLQVWMVEGGTPNTLLRRGLRRECLAPGTELIVDGYQTKDHSLLRANGRDVTFTDGRKMFMGSSGTGAPEDGAERRALEGGRERC